MNTYQKPLSHGSCRERLVDREDDENAFLGRFTIQLFTLFLCLCPCFTLLFVLRPGAVRDGWAVIAALAGLVVACWFCQTVGKEASR